MKNKAYYLTDIEKFELKIEEVPELGDNDVLVENKYMGVCGSDVWFFVDGGKWIENHVIELPMLLGHEVAGVVKKVGKNVKKIRIGDNVAVEPGIPCGKCEYCLEGRYNLCPDVRFLADKPASGGALCQYLVWPEHMTHKLPDNVSLLEGAMIEPFAVGVHASKLSGIGMGDSVVILGAGCIGLMTLLACKARGCGDVVMIDIFDNRLQKAKELGADHVINSANENAEEIVEQLTNGGAKYVFECAGNPKTTEQSVRLVRRGGTIVIIGSLHEANFSFGDLKNKEARIITSFRYANIYPVAIKAVAEGKAKIADVVTDLFEFDDAQAAFEAAAHNKQKVTKAAIRF